MFGGLFYVMYIHSFFSYFMHNSKQDISGRVDKIQVDKI